MIILPGATSGQGMEDYMLQFIEPKKSRMTQKFLGVPSAYISNRMVYLNKEAVGGMNLEALKLSIDTDVHSIFVYPADVGDHSAFKAQPVKESAGSVRVENVAIGEQLIQNGFPPMKLCYHYPVTHVGPMLVIDYKESLEGGKPFQGNQMKIQEEHYETV